MVSLESLEVIIWFAVINAVVSLTQCKNKLYKLFSFSPDPTNQGFHTMPTLEE